jgi:glutaredoxin
MKLELFHKMACPYSAKVRDFIDAQGIRDQITYRDILEDKSNHDQLMELTGDHQVPCLVIDGKPLLESDDIIAWLDENLAGSDRAAG